jgi:UDP-N-acetylglucosamine:LPS N-acetylglucosamine transferase
MTRRILLPLGGGGFAPQTCRIINQLGPENTFFYVVPQSAKLPEEHGVPPGPTIRVPQFRTFTRGGVVEDLHAFTFTFTKSLLLIKKEKIDLVVCVAIRHSIPILLAARLARVRGVFVESIARITEPSVTARIIYRLRLAHHFYFQWPKLQKHFPHATLATSL